MSEPTISSPSTSSVAAFRAKTSVTLDDVPGYKAGTAAFGQSSSESFANFDPVSCSWKTRQVSLFGGLAPFSGTWPVSGMTRNGTAYPLRPSVPRTYELARGFLPTPVASDTGHRRQRYSQGGSALSFAVGGPVNPTFAEWMMGLPTGHTACEP